MQLISLLARAKEQRFTSVEPRTSMANDHRTLWSIHVYDLKQPNFPPWWDQMTNWWWRLVVVVSFLFIVENHTDWFVWSTEEPHRIFYASRSNLCWCHEHKIHFGRENKRWFSCPEVQQQLRDLLFSNRWMNFTLQPPTCAMGKLIFLGNKLNPKLILSFADILIYPKIYTI